MGKILIVEDDDAARNLLADILHLDKHDVIAFASADGVIESFLADSPDLAIIDINLPTEHGVSLSWRMRCHFPSLPILIASAILDRWDQEDIADCGVDYLLAKPYNVAEIREVIQLFLEKGRDAVISGEAASNG